MEPQALGQIEGGKCRHKLNLIRKHQKMYKPKKQLYNKLLSRRNQDDQEEYRLVTRERNDIWENMQYHRTRHRRYKKLCNLKTKKGAAEKYKLKGSLLVIDEKKWNNY